MAVLNIVKIVADMKRNPKGIRFQDLCKVSEHYFGPANRKQSQDLSNSLAG
jgi:hypothetical protein